MGVRQAVGALQGLAQWAYGWLLLRQDDKGGCFGREKEKRLHVMDGWGVGESTHVQGQHLARFPGVLEDGREIEVLAVGDVVLGALGQLGDRVQTLAVDPAQLAEPASGGRGLAVIVLEQGLVLVVEHQGLAGGSSGKALDDSDRAGGVDVPVRRVHLAAIAWGERARWGDLQQDVAALQAGLGGHLVGAGRDGHGRGRSEGRAHGDAGAAEAVTGGGALRHAAMVCGGALRVLCPRPLNYADSAPETMRNGSIRSLKVSNLPMMWAVKSSFGDSSTIGNSSIPILVNAIPHIKGLKPSPNFCCGWRAQRLPWCSKQSLGSPCSTTAVRHITARRG